MTSGAVTTRAIGDIPIVVDDSGPSSAPAVIYLHGTSANAHVWDAVVAAAGPHRAVQLDQRGHGRSGDGETYEADGFVDDVVTVIAALELGRAIVVGHSLGARNAWVLAARHPSLFAGVVAVDYTPYVEPEVLDALAVRVAGGDRSFAGPDEIRAYLRDRYPLLPEDAIERRALHGYAERGGAWAPLARAEALQGVVQGLRTDYPDELAAVAAPMTMVRGEGSAIVSRAAWDRAQPLAPAATWVEVAGVDHYVPEEQPAAIAAIVDGMLQTITTKKEE